MAVQKWTPEQYDRYQALIGRYAKPRLTAAVTSSSWRTMNREDRQDRISSIMKAARRSAKDEVLGTTPPAASRDSLPAGFAIDR